MKQLLFYSLMFFLCVLGSTLLQSKDSNGKKLSNTQRDVSDFNRVLLDMKGTLYIQQTGIESLNIVGSKDAIDNILATVEYGELIIKHKKRRGWFTRMFFSDKDAKFYLTVKNLEDVAIGGSGKVFSEGEIKSDQLKLSVRGSGDIRFEVMGKKLQSEILGSGNIMVVGKVDEQSVVIEGSGSYVAKDLKSKSAKVTIEGSGNAVVNSSDELKATISGSGIVSFNGKPKIYKNISGSGSVLPVKK